MPHNRFYIDSPLESGSSILLDGTEALHLVRVMRCHEGDVVECVNGRGVLAQCLIGKVRKESVELTILESNYLMPSHEAIVVQALSRHLDEVVEKGCELGMSALWLYPAALSEKKSLSENEMQRLERIAISAMKQCGRRDLPPIILKPPLLEWSSFPLPAFYGDLEATEAFHPPSSSLFIIGPEKGLSHEEKAHLKQIGAQGVKLHPNILRTQTASQVYLSLVAQNLL